MDKKNLRKQLFRHLDGLVTAPIVNALENRGVLAHFIEHKTCSISNLTTTFKANEGYLNVALRALSSQGFLTQHVDNATEKIEYTLTENGAIAFEYAWLYEEVSDMIRYSGNFHPRKFQAEPFERLCLIFEKYQNNYGLDLTGSSTESRVHQQMMAHIEGILVGPSLVHLGMSGMFHKYFMETSFRPEEFHQTPELFERLLNFFKHLGWFNERNGNYQFTDAGLFFAKRAAAYGVTVSYLPNFRHLDDLIFGDADKLRQIAIGEDEKHVDREMNVWGSGGAHTAYFKVIDEIIIELFNRPIAEQPKGVLDMGCGNGAYLEHIFNVIDNFTLRGKMLDDYPLFLVGADFNQAALKVTRANLIRADIWAKVVWGDIGNPQKLASDLMENYQIELGDLLNVRSFLDHNRIWEEPTHPTPNRISTSTGAFTHRGKRISNNAVEDNLLEHFKKWAPYVKKYGLLLIELHTIDPAIAAANLGLTAATAYDATHGFSDQYIVEIEVFHKVCAEAGLFPDPTVFRKFPNNELATVSINLLRG
jgi:DNA-binding PadR family transcriptional regulator/SAM-dependent methyltransferase